MTTLQPKLFPTVTAAGYGDNDPSSLRSDVTDEHQMGVLAELRTTLDGLKRDVSTPVRKCGGGPEQKCSSGASKKAPDIWGLLAC